MTAADLIAQLETVPPDTIVFIGWEGITNRVEWSATDVLVEENHTDEDGNWRCTKTPGFVLGDKSWGHPYPSSGDTL